MDPYYPRDGMSVVERPSRRFGWGSRFHHWKNYKALFLLVLIGCVILFFTIVLITCAFVVNYGNNYEVDGYQAGIEETVQSTFHYAQYWAGVPFLITGILVIFSGTFQRRRALTICTAILCVLAIMVAMFVAAIDGPNWYYWAKQQGIKTYWSSQSGVDCTTVETSGVDQCTCKTATATTALKTLAYSCSEISQLSSLYGAIVASAILVMMFSVLALLIITKSLSWKRIRRHYHRRHYDNDRYRYDDAGYYKGHHYETFEKKPYYEPDFFDYGRRTPSVIDLPYAKRGKFIENHRPIPLATMPRRVRPYPTRGYPY